MIPPGISANSGGLEQIAGGQSIGIEIKGELIVWEFKEEFTCRGIEGERFFGRIEDIDEEGRGEGFNC